MNTVQNLVQQVKLSTDYQTNKRILKEKILTELHMPYGNGLFLLTPTLLAFAATWPDEILYLEDVYENPIEIHRLEFLEKARAHYQQAMNEWHQQHEDLKRIRKV
jgi:hypothetical protein